jgi:hypothetical protein
MRSISRQITLVVSTAAVATLLAWHGAAEDAATAEKPAEEASATENPPAYETISLRGRVVWWAEALERRFGIASDPDSARANVALETPEGELHLLIKDARGRAFMLDERLMGRDLELVLRRYPGAGGAQVVKIFAWEDDGKFELDYWCDICAIPMYELKACECCQGETRIRLRGEDGRERAAD